MEPVDELSQSDALEALLDEGQPWEQDRPIDSVNVEANVEPKRKELPMHMSSKLQLGLITVAVVGVVLGVAWFLGAFEGEPTVALTDAQIENQKLRKENKELKDRENTRQTELTKSKAGAKITEFQGQKKGIPPGRVLVSDKANQSKAKPIPAPRSPTQKPVSKANTVRLPSRPRPIPRIPRSYAPKPAPRSYPRPLSSSAPPKPPGPSLADRAGYLERGMQVPQCKKYGIKKTAPKPADSDTLLARRPTPKPVRRPVRQTRKPLELAYAQDAQQKPKSPNYQVNYMAGEMQTTEQFEAEFYGSNGAIQATTQRMKAKVVGVVQWLDPRTALGMVIPLEITSGPHKGLTAEAQITSIKGNQFTATVQSINNQPVKGGYELHHSGTKFLMAKIKTQGGPKFGDRLLQTATAIAGDYVSDQVGNFRGGNNISRLLPNGQGSRNSTAQYFEFKGSVELVPPS